MTGMNFLELAVLLIFSAVSKSESQKLTIGKRVDVALEILQQLLDKIDKVNRTNLNYAKDIDAIYKRLDAHVAKEQFEIDVILLEMKRMSHEMDKISVRMKTNEGNVMELMETMKLVQIEVANSTKKIGKLQKVNEIWKGNFKVLDRAFQELKSKWKIVIMPVRFPILAKKCVSKIHCWQIAINMALKLPIKLKSFLCWANIN